MGAEAERTAGAWEATSCALCDASEAATELHVGHVDAPDGISAIVRCEGCGLRRLDPRPGPTAVGRYYEPGHNAFGGRRRGVAAQWLWELLRDVAAGSPRRLPGRRVLGPLARQLFDVVLPLDGSPGLRVLDVGCGYGDLLVYLRSRGCDVTGVDLDGRAAEAGRSLGLPIHVGDLVDVALPADAFDAAVLCHSLEHVPDPAGELREVARLLRPGGRLHIAVPNGRAAAFVVEGAEWEHLSHPLHFWFFDRDTLARLLERAGLRLVGPPETTNAYRFLRRWLRELRTLGVIAATRRFAHCLRAHRAVDDGGEVLRVVAERVSAPSPRAGPSAR